MSEFIPSFPFNVKAYILTPQIETVKGVEVKIYPAPTDENLFFCSFKTYGGTEINSNGLYVVEDTANIETWYRPDIKSDSAICLADNHKKIYEVVGVPENINMRNQFLKFKVKAISGGA